MLSGRRRFLTHSLSLGLSATLINTGCSSRKAVAAAPANATVATAGGALEGASLAPVHVHPSREIRTVVGLRPFRPSGFVVRREDRDGRALVHNYGHGGGGVTLSWGSAQLAVGLASPIAGQECAVVGGGVIGLSTARLLQLHGARVTIYTRDLPPATTSNIAGAQWWPVTVFEGSKRSPDFSRQFEEASRISYRLFQNLVGPYWGVRWLPNYFLSDEPPRNGWIGGPGGVLHDLQVDFRDFGPGEHVFPAKFVRRFQTMMVEPATYLNTLLREVQITGARIEVRELKSNAELWMLPQRVVFLCAGLGSKPLAADEELTPIKGQLTVLLPQPEVNYNLLSPTGYMFPRSDGILLGGTQQRGEWSLQPDLAAKQQILAAHTRNFAELARNQGRAQR